MFYDCSEETCVVGDNSVTRLLLEDNTFAVFKIAISEMKIRQLLADNGDKQNVVLEMSFAIGQYALIVRRLVPHLLLVRY